MAGRLLAQDGKAAKPGGVESEHRGHQKRSLGRGQASGKSKDGSVCEDSARGRSEYTAGGSADCGPQCVSSWAVDVAKAYVNGLNHHGRILPGFCQFGLHAGPVEIPANGIDGRMAFLSGKRK